MSKESLYFFDSSDDEEVECTSKKILNTFSTVPSYLASSYVLTEIGQSILKKQSIEETYTKSKNSLHKDLHVPEGVERYSKTKKFLGKFLIQKGSTDVIDLDKKTQEFINKISKAGNEAKNFLHKNDIFSDNVENIFQEEQKNNSYNSNAKKLKNICIKMSANLLQMLQANAAKNDNIRKFTKTVFAI